MSRLVIAGLVAGYGGTAVLRGIDLAVEAGEAVALFGANGSGKSTLLRCISGLVAYEGSIALGDVALDRLRAEQIAALGVAHVPQGRGTFVGFTVEENLILGATRLRGRAARLAALGRVYGLLPELAARRRSIAGTLSGGEQQVLAIGRALMMDPMLLLLDEPSLGLAPRIVHRLFEALSRLRAEVRMSMLVVEQNPRLVAGLAGRVHFLEDGRVALTARGDDPAFTDLLTNAYLALDARNS